MPGLDLWVLCWVSAVLDVVVVAAREVFCATIGCSVGACCFDSNFKTTVDNKLDAGYPESNADSLWRPSI